MEERQVKSMEISKTNSDQNERYKLTRLGFIIFLLISPLLPYAITMAYNSLVFVTLPARVNALPVYPGARLQKEILRPDLESDRCLQLIVQYKNNTITPFEVVREYYESALPQSGWHRRSPGSTYYSKGPMRIIRLTGASRSFRLVLTVGAFPAFQPGCLQ